MAAVYAFTPSVKQASRSGFLDVGGGMMHFGLLSASGTYTTGGDAFPAGKSPEDFLKRIGAGIVLMVFVAGIPLAEWDAVNKKLKLYTGAVPVAEIANATSVATLDQKPIAFLGL